MRVSEGHTKPTQHIHPPQALGSGLGVAPAEVRHASQMLAHKVRRSPSAAVSPTGRPQQLPQEGRRQALLSNQPGAHQGYREGRRQVGALATLFQDLTPHWVL